MAHFLDMLLSVGSLISVIIGIFVGTLLSMFRNIWKWLVERKNYDIEGIWMEEIKGVSEGKISICKIFFDKIEGIYKVNGFNILENGNINLKWRTVSSKMMPLAVNINSNVIEKECLFYVYLSEKDGKLYDNGSATMYFEQDGRGKYVPVGGRFRAADLDSDESIFSLKRINVLIGSAREDFDLDDDGSCKEIVNRLVKRGILITTP